MGTRVTDIANINRFGEVGTIYRQEYAKEHNRNGRQTQQRRHTEEDKQQRADEDYKLQGDLKDEIASIAANLRQLGQVTHFLE